MYKNKEKAIDIIMPNYNKGEYIDEAIKSVINQTYKNWKLFIIDDNSKDNSLKVIKKFKKNRNIKVILSKKNKGPSFCRNLGLKNSKSKFVAFLDSDDYWVKNKLKSQMNFMLKNNFHFSFTDFIPILQKKNEKKILKATKIENNFDFNKFVKNSSINTSTIILEKKFIKNIKFRNVRLMEDYIFKCELMKKSKIPFKKYPQATAIYRIIENSRSSKKILNLLNLWKINKIYNKLNFFNNLLSIIFISLNSFKKYGFK